MHGTVVEVKSAVVQSFEGESFEVHGGAYLSPEAFLSTESELNRLRQKQADLEQRSHLLPSLVLAAGLLGVAAGYWLGRRTSRPRSRLGRLLTR